jgi:hypothetical protein
MIGMNPSTHKQDHRLRHHIHCHRPHAYIPEIYQASKRAMPGRIKVYGHPTHFLAWCVNRVGTIRVFDNQVFVSNTLQEEYVGLEEVEGGVYDLYFCFYQIGRYDLQSKKIQGIVSKVGLSVKRVGPVSSV